MVLGKGDVHVQKIEIDAHLTPYHKHQPAWIEDGNLRPETIKLLKKNIREKPLDINVGHNIFWI